MQHRRIALGPKPTLCFCSLFAFSVLPLCSRAFFLYFKKLKLPGDVVKSCIKIHFTAFDTWPGHANRSCEVKVNFFPFCAYCSFRWFRFGKNDVNQIFHLLVPRLVINSS